MLNKVFLRYWAQYFILTFVVIAAVIFPLLRLYDQNRLKIDLSHDSGRILKAEHQLQSMFHERSGDIKVLAQSPCLARFLAHPTLENSHGVTQMMRSVCHYYGIYDQIRLVNPNGLELVRVNFDGGKCSKVPQENLQSKVDRYYYKEALILPADQIFISPLDLNVEHDKVEVPHKPMIRFALPLKDQKGAPLAVLVMNFLGKSLLDSLFEQQSMNDGSGTMHYSFLVNENGYYLKSQMFPEKEFAFMFGANQNLRFPVDFPDAWQAARTGKDQIRTDQGLFLIREMSVPISTLSGKTIDIGTIVPSKHWYLFHFMPKESIKHASLIYGSAQPVLISIHIIFSLLISFLLAQRKRVLQQKKKDTQTIRNLYKKNALILSSTGDGIYGVDIHGNLTFLNPAAENMLGWTQDQILGVTRHVISDFLAHNIIFLKIY